MANDPFSASAELELECRVRHIEEVLRRRDEQLVDLGIALGRLRARRSVKVAIFLVKGFKPGIRFWRRACRATTALLNSVRGVTRRSATSRSGSATNAVPKQTVVVFPVIDWNYRFQRPQHLAGQLAASGRRVLYLTCVPLESYGQPGYSIDRDASGIAGVDIVTLFGSAGSNNIYTMPMFEYQRLTLRASLVQLLRDEGIESAELLVHHPYWWPLAQTFHNHPVIYDLMDDHAAFGTTSILTQRAEESLLANADLVVATSASLEVSAQKANPFVTRIPNGVDWQSFGGREKSPSRDGERKVVGYVGAMSTWFDFELVRACALAHPEAQFVLAGRVEDEDGQALAGLKNVTLLGEIAYSDVPTFVSDVDVCLIPFKVTPLTMATNPVKVYEYLSLGKPVVAVRLPELNSMSDLVFLADTKDEFVRQLESALEESDSADARAQRIAFAQDNTWDQRGSVLASALEALTPSVTIIVLSFNKLDLTKMCVESILKRTRYSGDWQLLVVDNGSTDGTRDYLIGLARDEPKVEIQLNNRNLGFSAGLNSGLRNVTTEYVTLLNNDVIVTDGWLFGLIRHLRRDSSLFAVGPVTNSIGNEAQVAVTYDSLEQMPNAAAHYTDKRPRTTLSATTLAFFCIALPMSVVHRVGLLDERFGVGYFEDDDYCRRIEQAGGRVAIAEDVFVHHEHSATFESLQAQVRSDLFKRNKRLYEEKWGPWVPHRYRETAIDDA